jgi:hypothetical protein
MFSNQSGAAQHTASPSPAKRILLFFLILVPLLLGYVGLADRNFIVVPASAPPPLGPRHFPIIALVGKQGMTAVHNISRSTFFLFAGRGESKKRPVFRFVNNYSPPTRPRRPASTSPLAREVK